MPTLSIVTFCSNPISMQFPFKELILSSLQMADEIIVINGDRIIRDEFSDLIQLAEVSEVTKVLLEIKNETTAKDYTKIKVYYNPWEDITLRQNVMVIQKSAAISHATCDYIIALDSDEILHEEDYPKIKQAMQLGHNIYTLKWLHFWHDYNHIIGGNNTVDPGEQWYKRRPVFFKNGLGVFDGYRYIPSEKQCRYTSDLTTWRYKPIMQYAQHTSIRVFHYGGVRHTDVYLQKKNAIEHWYHDNYKDLTEWRWDMSNTSLYSDIHPSVMKERIKEFKQKGGDK